MACRALALWVLMEVRIGRFRSAFLCAVRADFWLGKVPSCMVRPVVRTNPILGLWSGHYSMICGIIASRMDAQGPNRYNLIVAYRKLWGHVLLLIGAALLCLLCPSWAVSSVG